MINALANSIHTQGRSQRLKSYESNFIKVVNNRTVLCLPHAGYGPVYMYYMVKRELVGNCGPDVCPA